MRELKATVIFAVLAILVVSGGCSKKHGSDSASNAAPKGYTVSLAAEQLKGSGLMLRNNGVDDLYLTKNQTYNFRTRLVNGEPYDVEVVTQPTNPSQTCTVTNGTGVISGRNVNLVVSCTTNKYTVSGTVTGLVGEVILRNDILPQPYLSLTIDTNGPFTFDKDITDGKNYSVFVFRQPTVQTCKVTNGSGFLRGVNIDNVVVNCADNVPTISITGDSKVEGDTGTSYLDFIVNLSLPTRQDVTVDYATTDGSATTALPNSDYTSTSGTLTINAGTSIGTIAVPILGDTIPEKNETLTVTLTNPSSNATFGGAGVVSRTATGTIFNDDGGVLNDTGITTCANADTNGLACSGTASTYPGQDAEFGRDVTDNDDTNGHAGFKFEKIGNDGQPLVDQSVAWDPSGSEAANSQWSCVQDQTTGLLWEVKTSDGGIHDKNWTYSWYDTNSVNNGGDPGTPGGGSCGATLTACDTKKLITAVNADRLCGYGDWRLPSAEESSSLIDSSVSSGATIDIGWFPNTINSLYWTVSPYAAYSYYAWGSDFGSGAIVGNLLKQNPHYARLVRGGQ